MNFAINLDEDFTLKIGAHTWHVQFVDVVDMGADSTTWGLCTPEKHLIQINKVGPPAMRLSTLLHELMHAFDAVYDFELDHHLLNLSADALAQVMLDSLRSEPKKRRKA